MADTKRRQTFQEAIDNGEIYVSPESQSAAQAQQPAQAQPVQTQIPQTVATTPQAVPQSQMSDLASLARQQYGQRTPLAHADTFAIRGHLEQAKDAAIQEAAGQVDRSVTQGVNELQRVQEDAEEKYRTQYNQIDRDERLALDNRAAYDAARGVRGDIAGEQYSAIQNTAAQNRVTLNAARTKLGTDLQREMASLRANGEWEKSRALLQATQQYMSQLAQLEQWAQDFNVGVDQFNAQMEQNYLNYLLQLRQMDISTDQWEREFAANRADTAWNQRFQREQADTARNQWQQTFDADRADTAWNQQFQREQFNTSRNQWEREFAANRSDTAWNQRFQREQADTARNQWQQTFDANRADNAWQQEFQKAQADFTRQQYTDTLADKTKQEALSRAEAMMNVGMLPDAETLKAAGLTKQYAQLYISSVETANKLASEQAAVELEGKKADTLKKTAEASRLISGDASTSGSLAALAKAFVESGSQNPKTWLAENYKAFGFTSKPDFDEFQDAVDDAENLPKLTSTAFDFSPDEGIITFNGQKFRKLVDFVEHVNALARVGAFTESDWDTLMTRIRRYPELTTALEQTETEE